MRRNTLNRLITVLCLLAAMVAVVLGVGVWMYTTVQPEVQAELPPTANDDELTTSADLLPDRSKLLTVHEGTLWEPSGKAVTLAAMRDQPTVLLFWSSWCKDCKDYFAGSFNQARDAALAAGARFQLAVREGVKDETAQTAQDCLESHGISGGTLLDQEAALFKQLGLRSVPSMAFFNAQGVLMATTSHMPDAAEMTAILDYVNGGAVRQTEQLLRTMMNGGGVASFSRITQGRLVPQNTVLSESQGLMMLYALESHQQPLFDELLAYVRNSMTRSGLCAWQTADGQMADVNASLDDLRLVQALLRAEAKWGGYAQELSYRERALHAKCLRDDYLVDFADLSSGKAADTVTLCYQDAAAMEELAAYRQSWKQAAENARNLLERGLISEAFPLYWPKYDVEKDSFYGERLQMNEAMITVLNAARAGVAQKITLDWLETRLKEGSIAGAYTTDGQVVPGYEFESTATYALLVQIGLEADRPEMALMAMREMESLRAFEQPLVGGYGAGNSALYTFDMLQALLAWQQWSSVR